MDEEQQAPESGFPLVSDKPKGFGSSELLVGDHVHAKTEAVYRPTDGKFGHGLDSIGTVTFAHGDQAKQPFAAFFHLDDGSEASLSGRMPGSDSESLWLGRSTARVDEGTGQFEQWVGQEIPLESENPKRWG
jgi:hypothetical protein